MHQKSCLISILLILLFTKKRLISLKKGNIGNNKTAGEMLSSVRDDSEIYRRSKSDLFLYVALILFMISTFTGIILVFLIALGCLLYWILIRINKSRNLNKKPFE